MERRVLIKTQTCSPSCSFQNDAPRLGLRQHGKGETRSDHRFISHRQGRTLELMACYTLTQLGLSTLPKIAHIRQNLPMSVARCHNSVNGGRTGQQLRICRTESHADGPAYSRRLSIVFDGVPTKDRKKHRLFNLIVVSETTNHRSPRVARRRDVSLSPASGCPHFLASIPVCLRDGPAC
jgi:hypothetical protein